MKFLFSLKFIDITYLIFIYIFCTTNKAFWAKCYSLSLSLSSVSTLLIVFVFFIFSFAPFYSLFVFTVFIYFIVPCTFVLTISATSLYTFSIFLTSIFLNIFYKFFWVSQFLFSI